MSGGRVCPGDRVCPEGDILPSDLSHDACDVNYPSPIDRQNPVKHYLPATTVEGGKN